MKRALKIIGIFLGGLVLVGLTAFAVGPTVRIDESQLPAMPTPPAIDGLEAWIAEREAVFTDLTPETQETIVWADPATKARTPWAVVYVHGFSATRQETAPVADEVARALGANLFYARLAGHGQPGPALGEVSAMDWMADTVRAMAVGERLGERVLLVGCSTGAALAIWFSEWAQSGRATGPATTPPAAMVLLSPNVSVADPRSKLLTMPWGVAMVEAIAGADYEWEPANDGQRTYWTWRHPSRVLPHVVALTEYVQGLPAGKPDVPTLAIWTAHDQVVDVSAAAAWVDQAPNRTSLVFEDDVPRGNHVLAGRIMAPSRTQRVVDAMVGFVEDLPSE